MFAEPEKERDKVSLGVYFSIARRYGNGFKLK